MSGDDDYFFCQRISSRPPIFFSVPNKESRLGIAPFISPLVPTVPAVFLLGLWWAFDEEEAVALVGNEYREWQRQYPRHALVVLCNTQEQVALFNRHGMEGLLCHQNMFLDESVFKPIAGEQRRFKAIYNAGLTPFKRHELCAELDSLALIYGRWHGLLSGAEDYPRKVRAMLPQAFFVNDSLKPGEYVGLLPFECAQWYNRARVGLALSAVEGAMYVSMEYMMCGLPIVSTPSRGGRDYFFDNETCLIVEPTAQAVAAGVQTMLARDLAPAFVRQKALEKVRVERGRLLALLRAIFAQLGFAYPGDQIWDSFFINKMIRPVRRVSLPEFVFLER
jgi:glycosyltransferase involved in cell wall biosynthesis